MKLHRFASHSPEKMRRLSHWGYIVEGVLFGVVGTLAPLSGIGIAWASLCCGRWFWWPRLRN